MKKLSPIRLVFLFLTAVLSLTAAALTEEEKEIIQNLDFFQAMDDVESQPLVDEFEKEEGEANESE